MVEVASRRWSVETDCESGEARNRSRRLQHLQEQLLRENRRSAGPFSHPLASRGPLWILRDQIRDVSRIADAVATNADSATDARLNELCSDLRRLLQTQQRWTERLENQIWRMESQANLMRRLQQTLLHGSPATDQLWQLCELIARETQAIPDGLLLFPEPGHRVVLPSEGVNQLAAATIEHARFSVFAAMSLFPDVRGADVVAGTFRASASSYLRTIERRTPDDSVVALRTFAEQISLLTPKRLLNAESDRLIDRTSEFASKVNELSATATDSIVPPGIREFYNALAESWPGSLHLDEAEHAVARSICEALGLSLPENKAESESADGDERLVLTHKLRWHDSETPLEESSASSSTQSIGKRVRKPNFLKRISEVPRFSVFSD